MKKFLSMMIVICLLLSVVSCTNNDTANNNPQNQTKDVVTTAPTNPEDIIQKTDEQSHYPVTITTYNYAKEPIEITFEKAPEKILAVYQNSIETLLALGLGDKMVAASGLDHDVKEEFKDDFSKIKYYDTRPSKEEVIALNPDFILAWYSIFADERLGEVNFWIDRGTNTYMAKNSGVAKPDSLQNEYDDILNIGKIFEVEDKAETLVKNMKEEITNALELVKDKSPVKTVILEEESEGTFRVYGKNSIGGDIATQLGADLLASENKTIGAEDLIKLDPDVIFMVYYGEEIDKDGAYKGIMENPAFASMSSVKNERVYTIMLGEVYASGIRTLDGIKTISKGLYPDLN